MKTAASWQGLRVIPFAGALLSAFLLVSCAAGAPPDDRVLPPAQPTEARDDTPRNDLADERTVDWTRHEVVSGFEIRVYFIAGTPDCYGARATVSETAAMISIAVIEGAIPGAPEECVLVARQASLLVRTSSPIGDRTIATPSRP